MMSTCSNCELATATAQCIDCLDRYNGNEAENESNESYFCSDCCDIHKSLKNSKEHSFREVIFKEVIKTTERSKCCNCESNVAEYSCLDCPAEEQKYCLVCSELHSKVKSTRFHRICSHDEAKFQGPSHVGDSSNFHMEKGSPRTLPSSSFSDISQQITMLYTSCGASTYLGELVETLSYFDFPVSNDDLPNISIGVSFLLLLILICTFQGQIGEMIRSNGSAIASIIGGIAFLRFVQNSKVRNSRHDTKVNQARLKKERSQQNMVPFKACSGTSNSHIQARNKPKKVINHSKMDHNVSSNTVQKL